MTLPAMLEASNPDVYREVLETLHTGVFMVDRAGRISFWNEGAEKISGYRRHEALGHCFQHNILAHCDEHSCDLCGANCPIYAVLHEGKAKSNLLHFQHKDGHSVAVQTWTVPIRNSHGSVIGAAQSFSEIHPAASEEPAQSSSQEQASPLPGPEDTQFYLHEHLASFTQYHLPFGILRISVSDLAKMGMSRGRAAEHALVRLLTQTLRENLDKGSFLGRWSTDEFLAIVPKCTAHSLHEAAVTLNEHLSGVTLHWWGDSILIKANIGQTLAQAGDTMESLLHRAGFAPVTYKKNASAGFNV